MLTSPAYRIAIGTVAFMVSIYLAIATDKDYGVMLAFSGSLISAGLVKSLTKK